MQKAFEAASPIPEPLTLAFNVSPLQLYDLDLPKQIRGAAEEFAFALQRVVIKQVIQSIYPANLFQAMLRLYSLVALRWLVH